MRAPLRIGPWRGYRYAELDPELLEQLPRWLAEGRVAGGIDLKDGRVFRWRDVVVKFGRPRRRWRDALRPSPAVRSADLHEKLAPVATPRPLLALEQRSLLGLRNEVLVSEFVAGRELHALFRSDAAAVEAFPLFLAELHARGIFHGDFHLANALWDGKSWYLIDLESVRHRLHGLRPRKFLAAHWALVSFNLEYRCHAEERELRALYDAYRRRLSWPGDVEAEWRAIRARARALREAWDARGPRQEPA